MPPTTGKRDIELRDGVTVRADPDSTPWKRFKGALDKITRKESREAAEGLVNGGELTTDPDARQVYPTSPVPAD